MKPSEAAEKLRETADSLDYLDDQVETHSINTAKLSSAVDVVEAEAVSIVGEIEEKENEDEDEDEDEDKDDDELEEEEETD
jgi:hypothetical protein